MTDDQIEKFRASERDRMAPMKEAMRKEAFVQGFLRGQFGDLSKWKDEALLAALPGADAAYDLYRKERAMERHELQEMERLRVEITTLAESMTLDTSNDLSKIGR